MTMFHFISFHIHDLKPTRICLELWTLFSPWHTHTHIQNIFLAEIVLLRFHVYIAAISSTLAELLVFFSSVPFFLYGFRFPSFKTFFWQTWCFCFFAFVFMFCLRVYIRFHGHLSPTFSFLLFTSFLI